MVENPGTGSADQLITEQGTNGNELLEKLAALPVSTWRYVWEDPSIRHLGPMAQDFATAFGLGNDDRTISVVDAIGVATVAIQALYRRLRALEVEDAALRIKISKLEAAIGSGDSRQGAEASKPDPEIASSG